MRSRISQSGPIPYREVIELALYDPDHGFYSSGGRAGRRGDFLTSPEVGPLFGALVAEAIDREWERQGQPSTFTVVDAGAGPGTLARSVEVAEPRCRDALDYVCVEVSDGQRQSHPGWVASRAELPPGPITGLVLANELLDNLPFTPLEWIDDRWVPAAVALDGQHLVEVYEGANEGVADPVPELFEDGPGRVVYQRAAIEWLERVLHRVVARGRVIVIDYCRSRSTDVEIRTYAAHGRGADPLSALGSQDITVDVDLGALERATRAADVVSTQSEWLAGLGLDALVEQGRTAWSEGARLGDLEALRGRSRVREAEALCDPTGLGGFTVAEWLIDP